MATSARTAITLSDDVTATIHMVRAKLRELSRDARRRNAAKSYRRAVRAEGGQAGF